MYSLLSPLSSKLSFSSTDQQSAQHQQTRQIDKAVVVNIIIIIIIIVNNDDDLMFQNLIVVVRIIMLLMVGAIIFVFIIMHVEQTVSYKCVYINLICLFFSDQRRACALALALVSAVVHMEKCELSMFSVWVAEPIY
jgi:hypothetical protein